MVKNKLPPTIGVLDSDGYDDPIRFLDLSPLEQVVLVTWVLNTLAPSKGINYADDSYSLKHYFSDSGCGFYIMNGMFKGAMLVTGFKVADKQSKNWCFNIKPSSTTNLYRTKANIIDKKIKY
ncbi:hypothetical protein ACROUK_04690 [Companilactobacillus alimentarius]|uniref:hypothetical protein n=1 Tax=Companilactobacillus alimentarius TaxID=1602 RepID=UPI003D7CE4E8